jgi:hypothetical protein
MNLFAPDLTPLVREIQAFKINQQTQQAQIIALLQEQNQLLKQLLNKN